MNPWTFFNVLRIIKNCSPVCNSEDVRDRPGIVYQSYKKKEDKGPLHILVDRILRFYANRTMLENLRVIAKREVQMQVEKVKYTRRASKPRKNFKNRRSSADRLASCSSPPTRVNLTGALSAPGAFLLKAQLDHNPADIVESNFEKRGYSDPIQGDASDLLQAKKMNATISACCRQKYSVAPILPC